MSVLAATLALSWAEQAALVQLALDLFEAESAVVRIVVMVAAMVVEPAQ